VAAAEGIQISLAALTWIAEAGDGSMRDAQSIFDQIISYAGTNIKDADVEENLGLTDRKYLFVLSEAVLKRNAGACLNILEEAYLAGIDMKHFYQMLLRHFRNLLLVKIAASAGSSFDIAPEEIEKLKKQTNAVSRETLQRLAEILIAEEESFRRSQEPRMKLETVLVKMAYLEPIIPLGEIFATIEAIEQKLRQGLPAAAGNIGEQLATNKQVKEIPADYGAKINIADEKNNEDSLLSQNKPTDDLETLRDNFKIFVKNENAMLAAKIDSAEILSYEKNCLTLGFPKDYIFLEDIKGKKQKDQLEQIAGKFFQGNVEIKIAATDAGKVNTSDSNGRSKTNSLNDMKREAINHPLLQKVMDEFAGAEVIEIKARKDKSR
jgi:DNA polymerase-3 subunit gamma/tau